MKQSDKLNLFVIGFLIFVSCNAQSTFEFQGREIQAGTKEHFKIPIKNGENSTYIPITVFNGHKNGQVLGMTAGVHGYEYPPIIGAQKLIDEIDLRRLEGTVILVQIANMPSFSGRSPFVNPIDGKNLNRSFPGKEKGSLTEQIAYFISNEVIARSDFFLDVHAGDASEDLIPYGAYYSNDEKPEVSKKGRSMAISLGFDLVVIFDTTGKAYLKKGEKSLYCSAEAFKRNIPAMDIECGGLGKADAKSIDKIVNAVMSLLKAQKMYGDVALPTRNPKFCKDRFYVESEHEGIFYSDKKAGDQVEKNEEIGYITDVFGKVLDKIYAPERGTILYKVGTPPINKGEALFNIGQFQEN